MTEWGPKAHNFIRTLSTDYQVLALVETHVAEQAVELQAAAVFPPWPWVVVPPVVLFAEAPEAVLQAAQAWAAT